MRSVLRLLVDGTTATARGGRVLRRLQPTLVAVCLLANLSAVGPGIHRVGTDGSDEQQALSEHEVKAAFLFNFSKFVEWPADVFAGPSAALVIGVFGGDPIGPPLESLAKGRTINGHGVLVRRLRRTEDVAGCHALFVPASELRRFDDILLATRNKSVLAVGETDDFLRRGGTIRLLVENRQMRYEVNVGAAEAGHLKLSSRLLSSAAALTDDRKR